MKKYILLLVSATLILGATVHLAKQQFFNVGIGNFLTSGLVYFFVLTLAGHYVLTKSKEGRPQSFVNAFMGFSAVKMFLTLTVIAVYVYAFRGGFFVVKNAIIFTGMYFIYTVFESVYLLTHNKTA
jgi:hypothetical protein